MICKVHQCIVKELVLVNQFLDQGGESMSRFSGVKSEVLRLLDADVDEIDYIVGPVRNPTLDGGVSFL